MSGRGGGILSGQDGPLSVLSAGWWIIPLVVIASLGSVAYATSGEGRPSYETKASLTVAVAPSLENENLVMRALELLERRTTLVTLSRIPGSDVVLRRAAGRIDVPLSQLRQCRVGGSILPGTTILRISVSCPEPDYVKALADEVVALTRSEATQAYPVFMLRHLDTVDEPSGPAQDSHARLYVIAGVLGLFLGTGGAYGVGVLRSARREAVTSEEGTALGGSGARA